MTSRPASARMSTHPVRRQLWSNEDAKPCTRATAGPGVGGVAMAAKLAEAPPHRSAYRGTVGRPDPFVHPVPVRYLEVDQQGVVFNMWYLAYFDDAMTAFLLAGGLPYTDMIAAGYDVQLVHTELDWGGSLGWGDVAQVRVALSRVGTTSFTLEFDIEVGAMP